MPAYTTKMNDPTADSLRSKENIVYWATRWRNLVYPLLRRWHRCSKGTDGNSRNVNKVEYPFYQPYANHSNYFPSLISRLTLFPSLSIALDISSIPSYQIRLNTSIESIVRYLFTNRGVILRRNFLLRESFILVHKDTIRFEIFSFFSTRTFRCFSQPRVCIFHLVTAELNESRTN